MNMKRIYRVVETPRFKKELAKAEKRGLKIEDFDAVVVMLKKDIPLPAKYRDHPLSGKFKGYRECHISPDWLIVYKKHKDELILLLSRTGTHSDLF